ncbi:hypothetical protein P7C70_g8116, partial [Phenoliferia sp. Uapishka_3]
MSSRSPGTPGPVLPSDFAEVKDEDLACLDIAQRLGQLTIKQFLNGHETSGDNISVDLLSEARKILDHSSEPQSPPDNFVYGVANAPTISVFPFSSHRWTSTQELIALLPSRDLAEAAAFHYWKEIDWYLHPTPRHIFQRHSDAVWLAVHDGTDVEPFALAVVLAVWSVGLSAMPAKSRVRQQLIERKEDTAKQWLDMASAALILGGFLERPDLEGADFLSAPFWSCAPTTCVSPQATTLIDRFTMLHLGDIDTKIPLPLPDENMGSLDPNQNENPMTSLAFRIKLAQFGEKVSHEAFGVKPVAYSSIMAFDRELELLEADIPAPYSFAMTFGPGDDKDSTRLMRSFLIHACMAQERLRLHRPYQTRSYVDETFRHSRDVCISAAQRIITIHASPVLNQAVWASMNYKAVCASIVLAIDLLQVPYGPHAEEHRRSIRGTLERIRKISHVSVGSFSLSSFLSVLKNGEPTSQKLCHRATKVLQFLLQRDNEILHLEHRPKRNRQNTGGSRTLQRGSEDELSRRTTLAVDVDAPPSELSTSTSTSASTTSWDIFDDLFSLNPSYSSQNEMGLAYSDIPVAPFTPFSFGYDLPHYGTPHPIDSSTPTNFPISFDFQSSANDEPYHFGGYNVGADPNDEFCTLYSDLASEAFARGM